MVKNIASSVFSFQQVKINWTPMDLFNEPHNLLDNDATQRELINAKDPFAKEERAISSYYDVLLEIENNSNGFDSLTEVQINQIELFAATDLAMATNFNNLLVYAEKRPEERKLWSPIQFGGSNKSAIPQNNFKTTQSNIKQDVSMLLYPNPSNGELNINYAVEDESGVLNITIHNLLGKQVFQHGLIDHQGSIKIETNKLSNGVYIVNLRNNGGILETKKLVIQH